jgi:DNA-binding Xre family transcriptional regulator
MINYDGLFTILKARRISKTALAKAVGMSSRTLAKLSNGEHVSLKTIEDICSYLNCTPGDILGITKETTLGKLLSALKEEKAMRLKGGLYHATQINMTYNSNHIEDSTLTEDQTRYIFETNTIGVRTDQAVNVDDVVETISHFRCIDYAIDIAESPLTEYMIKKLHEILKTNTSDSLKDWFAVGDYKVKPNFVGGNKTASPGKVRDELLRLINFYNEKQVVTIDDIIEFHHDFEAIHPFQDGNGRVGRLIAFKECLRFDIMPFIIDESLKLFYYRGLKEWNTERGYLLDTCKTGQDKYSAIVSYFFES